MDDVLKMLQAEFKAEKIRSAYLKGTPQYGTFPALQVTLPLGRAIHIYLVGQHLLISRTSNMYDAKSVINLVEPESDPQAIVALFKELLAVQKKFLAKCKNIETLDIGDLAMKNRGL